MGQKISTAKHYSNKKAAIALQQQPPSTFDLQTFNPIPPPSQNKPAPALPDQVKEMLAR